MQRRARDLAHAIRRWRLDQLGPAAHDQLLADTLRSALTRGDMLSQPRRQRLSVRDCQRRTMQRLIGGREPASTRANRRYRSPHRASLLEITVAGALVC
jgi:hypothetical protein